VRRQAIARAYSSDMALAMSVMLALQLIGLVAIAQFIRGL